MIGNYLRLPQSELDRVISAPQDIMEFLYPEDQKQFSTDRHLDTDKAWHVIHFLLTGTEWEGELPYRNAVLGGTEIGDVDVGYGPARFLTPAEVVEVSDALGKISFEELWSRFDLSAVREHDIYPSGWDGSEGDYVREHFRAMKEFFENAAKANEAILTYLN